MRAPLIILLLLNGLLLYSQDVPVYIDMDPGWHEKSMQYWQDARGYGEKSRSQVLDRVAKNREQLLSRYELELKEKLNGRSMNFVRVENPTDFSFANSDIYCELEISSPEESDDFPYYYKRILSGTVPVSAELIIYSDEGKILHSKKLLAQADLKVDVKKNITEKSEFLQDAEGFLLLLDKTSNSLCTDIVEELVSETVQSNIGAQDYSGELFHQQTTLRFERKKFESPNSYKELALMPYATAPVAGNQEVNAEVKDVVPAFDNVTLANDIGEVLRKVRYYALIIGVDEYQDPTINDLDNPVKDARNLAEVLTSNYTFDRQNIIMLENPTRDEIIRSLDNLAGTIREADNLLIFYAGHGLWDEQFSKGYWMPSDAAQNSRANWLSNTDLVDYVGGIKSKHTILIADACFSGAIFKTREVFTGVDKASYELYKYPSKKAMTSGAMKTVPDKSVFIYYLNKRLLENQNPFISSEEIFSSFKTAVINNSPNNQVPQFGVIQGAGDEGGDFLFMRRK